MTAYVSRDMVIEINPGPMGQDFTSVDATPTGDRVRAYRRLDPAWLAWLLRAAYRQARGSGLADAQRAELLRRGQELVTTAAAELGQQLVDQIRHNQAPHIPAGYQPPVPDPDLVARFEAAARQQEAVAC
jgi:hypothetical protein